MGGIKLSQAPLAETKPVQGAQKKTIIYPVPVTGGNGDFFLLPPKQLVLLSPP
ncbi:hypothetical protein hamaS1_07800 [Moorella sp. Hama-1]|nr:hypothetical protein hamaS1_07800 [Moorella sp. Hama-1]